MLEALFQFFTAVAVTLATFAFSHFGVAVEGFERDGGKPVAERSVKRSPAPGVLPQAVRVPA